MFFAGLVRQFTGSEKIATTALGGAGGAAAKAVQGAGKSGVGARIAAKVAGTGRWAARGVALATPMGPALRNMPSPKYWEQVLVLHVFPNIAAFFMYILSVVVALVGILFFLYQVLAVMGVTGRLSSNTVATGIQSTYSNTIGRLKNSFARMPYVVRVFLDVVMFVPATLVDFIVSTFAFFGMLFACWLILVLLVVFTWFFLNVESDPAAYVTNAALAQADFRDTYNVFVNVGGVYVTALVAFFNAIMNVTVNFIVQSIRLLLRYIGGELLGNSSSGDVGTDIRGNFGSMSTIQSNFGRRVLDSSFLEDVDDGGDYSYQKQQRRTMQPALASSWEAQQAQLQQSQPITKWKMTKAERRQLDAEVRVLVGWMSNSATLFRDSPSASGTGTQQRRGLATSTTNAPAVSCGKDSPYPVNCDTGSGFSDVSDVPFSATFDMVAMVTMWIAELVNVFAQIVLIVMEIALEIFVPIIRFLATEIASVFRDLGCAFISPGCAVMQLFNDFAVGAAAALNFVLDPIAKAISFGAFTGHVIPVPNIACGIDQLKSSSIPCNCHDFFTALSPCGVTMYTCTQNSLTGLWTQYVDRGDGTAPVVLASNQDQSLACMQTRRMLSSRLGVYRNMEETGSGETSVQRTCINGTLFEVPSNTKTNTEQHTLVYLGACPTTGRHGRRILTSNKAVPHSQSRAWLRDTLKTNADINVVLPSSSSDFGNDGSTPSAATAAISRPELVRRYWAEVGDSTTFIAGGVRCDLAREALPTTPAERHADWLCSIEMGRRAAARDNPTDNRGGFASTGNAALRPRHGNNAHRRRLVEEAPSSRRLAEFGLGLIHFGEAFRARSFAANAESKGDPRRRLDILTSELPSDVDTRKRLWGKWANQRIVTGAVKAALDVIHHEMRHASEFEVRDQKMRSERPGRRDLAGLIKTNPCLIHSEDGNTYLCPDGITCVREFSMCPEPEVWTPEVTARYTALSWKDELNAGSMTDIATSLLSCWMGYEKDPSTNPFALENFGKNLYTDKTFVWCPPLQRPSNFRLTPMTWDLASWVQEQCSDASCQCDGFSNFLPVKEVFDFDPKHQWRSQLPIFVYARLYNGMFAMQLGTAMILTNGTAFPDKFWQSLFAPLTPHILPLWFARMWSDMGIPGSGGQQALCVTLHLGSVWFTLTLLFFCILVFLAYWGATMRLMRRVVNIATFPVFMAVQCSMDDSVIHKIGITQRSKYVQDEKKKQRALENLQSNAEGAQAKLDDAAWLGGGFCFRPQSKAERMSLENQSDFSRRASSSSSSSSKSGSAAPNKPAEKELDP